MIEEKKETIMESIITKKQKNTISKHSGTRRT